MRLTAVELEPWQVDAFKQAYPDATLLTTPLTEEADAHDPEALAVFIYSQIDQAALGRMPSLKYITTMSTGYDHIDLAACRQRGIVVSNVPTYGEQTVAEHAVGLLLSLSRNIVRAVEETRGGNFDLTTLRGHDLGGKIAGIIGTGRIGQHVIKMLKGIGMEVIAYDPFPKPALATELGFTYVDLDQLLQTANAVSLHCPATKETEHILNRERLMRMKKTAFLINTARGTLIETAGLVAALEAGYFLGVGLDVLEEENIIKDEQELLSHPARTFNPLTVLADHVLLRHPRVIVTPHNAFNSEESIRRILNTTLENLKAFAAGQPANVVS